MRGAILISIAMLALSACSSASGYPGRRSANVVAYDGVRGSVSYPRRLYSVPRGHYPPPGECRIWYPGRPPDISHLRFVADTCAGAFPTVPSFSTAVRTGTRDTTGDGMSVGIADLCRASSSRYCPNAESNTVELKLYRDLPCADASRSNR
jgi:hypothetical protein